jgi:Putative zinc-finger
MTQEQHFDVAAYALGVLDERDATIFEDHLIDCPACAIELESLLPVVDILADVDADALVATEQSRRDGIILKKMIGEVRRERRQANSRRLYSLAAAVVVFAMLSIGALFAGAKWLAPADNGKPGTVVAQASTRPGPAGSSAELDPLPLSDNGAGIGGVALPGKVWTGADPRSGVEFAVGLAEKDMGTQITYVVSNIRGPKNCRLVLVHRDGSTETSSTWHVGEKGWGTPANPNQLIASALTATSRDDIAHVRVEEVDTKGTGSTLAQLPQ